MTDQIKIGVPSGHSELQDHENVSSELTDSRVTPDYSEHATVYKIKAARTNNGPLHQELGEAGKKLINEAVRLAQLMDKSKTPLPLELVINDAQKTVYYGKQFDLERDMTDTILGTDIQDVMSGYGVKFVAVMRNGADNNVYVTYGRGDDAEYLAFTHISDLSEEVF